MISKLSILLSTAVWLLAAGAQAAYASSLRTPPSVAETTGAGLLARAGGGGRSRQQGNLDKLPAALRRAVDAAALERRSLGAVAAPPPVAQPGPASLRISDGKAQVYLVVSPGQSTDDVLAGLFGYRLDIEQVDKGRGIIQAWVPLGRVDEIASWSAIGSIRLPDRPFVRTGNHLTAGDTILAAADARARFGLTGAGVKVGVLSDSASLASLNGAAAQGDLPPSSEIEVGNNTAGGDEGTAILEIVHDLAPDAQLAFYGVDTDVAMVEGLQWLADTAKCDVILDDLGFFGEPYFSDGPVATAVAQVVASGISYHSAAGNDAQGHYEADFNGVPTGLGTLHRFSSTQASMPLRLAPGEGTTIVLQWNEPFGQAGSDYDLLVLDATGGALACPSGCESNDVQNGNDDPLEAVALVNTGSTSIDLNVAVRKTAGATKRFELFLVGGTVLNYDVAAGSVFGHPAVDGVLAVGAISAFDSGHDSLESYSSRGPARVDFPVLESRLKPDVVAIDGVEVSGQSGFPSTFFGTSAAVPHSAAIAALLVQGGVSDGAQIYDCMTQSAVDLGSSGPDDSFGWGRLDAEAAVSACVVPVCGDGSLDRHLTATDALITLRTAVSASTCLACLCDFDGSGTITASDALQILRTSVGLDPTPACPAC